MNAYVARQHSNGSSPTVLGVSFNEESAIDRCRRAADFRGRNEGDSWTVEKVDLALGSISGDSGKLVATLHWDDPFTRMPRTSGHLVVNRNPIRMAS